MLAFYFFHKLLHSTPNLTCPGLIFFPNNCIWWHIELWEWPLCTSFSFFKAVLYTVAIAILLVPLVNVPKKTAWYKHTHNDQWFPTQSNWADIFYSKITLLTLFPYVFTWAQLEAKVLVYKLRFLPSTLFLQQKHNNNKDTHMKNRYQQGEWWSGQNWAAHVSTHALTLLCSELSL